MQFDFRVFFSVCIIIFYRSFVCACVHSETGVSGSVLVNGKNRNSNSQTFRSQSAYIHQDDALRKYLTVGEAMTVAAHLKLGFNVTKEYKMTVVSVFEFFLTRCMNVIFCLFVCVGQKSIGSVGIGSSIQYVYRPAVWRSNKTISNCVGNDQQSACDFS